jgi:hypothetical protein
MQCTAQSTFLCLALLLILPFRAGAATLDGVYQMKRYSPGATGRMEIATFTFHNGEVVRNPVGSADKPDAPIERLAHANAVGTYKQQAGELTLDLGGRNTKGKLEWAAGGCFRWDTALFCPVDGVLAGSRTSRSVSMAPATAR